MKTEPDPNEVTASITDDSSLLIELRNHGVSVETFPNGIAIVMINDGKGADVYEFDYWKILQNPMHKLYRQPKPDSGTIDWSIIPDPI